jgi:hypothetical protein
VSLPQDVATPVHGRRRLRRPRPTSDGRRPDHTVAWVIAGLRIGIGGTLLVAPAVAGRIWMGPHGAGPGTRVFARALGARDVALGLRLIADVRAGRSVVPALRLGVAADAADAVATLAAARELTAARRIVMPLVAASVAVLGALVTEEAEEAEDEAVVTDLHSTTGSRFGSTGGNGADQAPGGVSSTAREPG